MSNVVVKLFTRPVVAPDRNTPVGLLDGATSKA
jgi:hypothetical protein